MHKQRSPTEGFTQQSRIESVWRLPVTDAGSLESLDNEVGLPVVSRKSPVSSATCDSLILQQGFHRSPIIVLCLIGLRGSFIL